MYRGFSIENIENISVDKFLSDDFFYNDSFYVRFLGTDFLNNAFTYDIVSKRKVSCLARNFDAQFPKRAIHENLEKYCTMNGDFNAFAIQEDWFPQLDFDVFISHSHRDEEWAKAFAMILQEVFGLKVFVDSAVWGYFDTLLKEMRCNTGMSNAVSHAHMMLTMALMKMIDRTECLFFLNTPKSINLDEEFNTGTYSPWLYMEIGISRMIEKKYPERYKSFSMENLREKKLLKSSMWYQTDISHLTTLDADDLNSWQEKYQSCRGYMHSLDILYKLYPPESKN